MSNVSKAIAGAVAGGVTGMGTLIVIPPEVSMPWWGYLAVSIANAILGYGLVYFAPRNREY